MTNQQGAPEALRLAEILEGDYCPDWFYEQGVDEVAAELRRLHAENESLHVERERNLNSIRVCNEIINKKNAELESLTTGYAAARLEIESLQARIKTMAEEHADELMVAHMDGRMRAAQAIPGVQWQCGPQANGFTAPQADSQPAVDESYKQAVGSKNCMQCCVSYMLGLPLESVPNFATAGGWDRFASFAESQGYAAVMLPGNHEFEADYLASGATERGTPHMVVMNDGKLVHDPHPSNAGLVEVQSVWLLTKKATPQGHHDERAAFEASAKAYTSNVSFERDEHDYADMTASLLWHGWQLRAARAPADSVTAPAGGADWQDISTAPKDGTRFVAVGQNYGLDSEKQHTCIAQRLAGCWVEVSDWNGASKLKYLTHWMPLPPLPCSAARKQGENHD